VGPEKKKVKEGGGGPKKDSLWDQDSSDSRRGPVTVVHGPYAEELPAAGMTAEQIRDRFQDRLDIAPEALPYVEGTPVDLTTVLQEGQVLMFARRAGEKGVNTLPAQVKMTPANFKMVRQFIKDAAFKKIFADAAHNTEYVTIVIDQMQVLRIFEAQLSFYADSEESEVGKELAPLRDRVVEFINGLGE
jgi:hypothetical protein